MNRAELEQLSIHELRSRAKYLGMDFNHLWDFYEGRYSQNKKSVWVNALEAWEKKIKSQKKELVSA